MAKLNVQLERYKAEVVKYEKKLEQRRNQLDHQQGVVGDLNNLRDTVENAWDSNPDNWTQDEQNALARFKGNG